MSEYAKKYAKIHRIFKTIICNKFEKKLSNSINGNDVHKALKLNCEMYGPFNLRLKVLKIFPNQSFKF